MTINQVTLAIIGTLLAMFTLAKYYIDSKFERLLSCFEETEVEE